MLYINKCEVEAADGGEKEKAHWNIPEARAKARISSRIIHNNTLLPRVRLIKKSRAEYIINSVKSYKNKPKVVSWKLKNKTKQTPLKLISVVGTDTFVIESNTQTKEITFRGELTSYSPTSQ